MARAHLGFRANRVTSLIVPRRPSASHERVMAIHSLSEKVTVVLNNLPPLRQTLEKMQVPDLPKDLRALLDEALAIVTDMEKACRDSVGLFDELRKAI